MGNALVAMCNQMAGSIVCSLKVIGPHFMSIDAIVYPVEEHQRHTFIVQFCRYGMCSDSLEIDNSNPSAEREARC